MTCLRSSAAPGVPEDAEREGGGARYVLGPRWGGSGRPWSDSFGKLGSNLRGDPAALRPGNREGCTERKEQEVSHISTVSPGPLKGEKELALRTCSAKLLCPLSLRAKAMCLPCPAWCIRSK